MADTPSPAMPTLPLMAKKLRKAAKDVRSLNLNTFRSPEKLPADKDEIAVELEQLADMVSGRAA